MATVRKDKVFEEHLTSEEKEIVARRVALQQQAHRMYLEKESARKVRKIRIIHDHVTVEEAARALDAANGNEVRRGNTVIHVLTVDALAGRGDEPIARL